jgi:hypothetical protein
MPDITDFTTFVDVIHTANYLGIPMEIYKPILENYRALLYSQIVHAMENLVSYELPLPPATSAALTAAPIVLVRDLLHDERFERPRMFTKLVRFGALINFVRSYETLRITQITALVTREECDAFADFLSGIKAFKLLEIESPVIQGIGLADPFQELFIETVQMMRVCAHGRFKVAGINIANRPLPECPLTEAAVMPLPLSFSVDQLSDAMIQTANREVLKNSIACTITRSELDKIAALLNLPECADVRFVSLEGYAERIDFFLGILALRKFYPTHLEIFESKTDSVMAFFDECTGRNLTFHQRSSSGDWYSITGIITIGTLKRVVIHADQCSYGFMSSIRKGLDRVVEFNSPYSPPRPGLDAIVLTKNPDFATKYFGRLYENGLALCKIIMRPSIRSAPS